MNDLTADFADFVQADRTIKIETPLGADVLLPERAELTEGVNDLFEFRVAVRSKRSDIKAAEVVGHMAEHGLPAAQVSLLQPVPPPSTTRCSSTRRTWTTCAGALRRTACSSGTRTNPGSTC